MKEIAVPYEALKDYMEEYHNPKAGGTCKADGQDWPCKTYTSLREALDNPNNILLE